MGISASASVLGAPAWSSMGYCDNRSLRTSTRDCVRSVIYSSRNTAPRLRQRRPTRFRSVLEPIPLRLLSERIRVIKIATSSRRCLGMIDHCVRALAWLANWGEGQPVDAICIYTDSNDCLPMQNRTANRGDPRHPPTLSLVRTKCARAHRAYLRLMSVFA
jgi:hypothetical protein